MNLLLRALLGPSARGLGCVAWGLVLSTAAGTVTAGLARRWDRLAVFGLVLFAALAVLFHLAGRHADPSAAAESSHGSARWGNPRPHLRATGLLIGRAGRSLLRYDAEGHLLTVAPTGSGKGVSAVIPNLLTYPGSVFVIDLKGENYAVTAPRRRHFGPVVALDPFRIAGGGDDAFNPLDLIDPESELCDADAATLAYLLVLPATEGESAFWDEEAAALLAGLILHVAATEPAERRHLGTVRQVLTLGPEPWASHLLSMAECGAAHGLVARAANRLLQKADRERSGVVSTAQRHTHFLDSPAILRTLRASTVKLSRLKTETLSLYCILPPERLGSHGRWLRLLAGTAIDAMLRTPGLPAHRVLFLLNEFAQLGRIQPLEQAFTLLRGYGVRLWLMVQDFAQLRAVYGPRTDSILANAAVLQAFGINELQTAEYLSRKTGQATVLSATENRSTGQSFGRVLLPTRQSGQAQSASQTGRPLLMPDEIVRLDPRHQLLFLSGCEPLLLDRLNYLTDREFRGTFTPNPLHRTL